MGKIIDIEHFPFISENLDDIKRYLYRYFGENTNHISINIIMNIGHTVIKFYLRKNPSKNCVDTLWLTINCMGNNIYYNTNQMYLKKNTPCNKILEILEISKNMDLEEVIKSIKRDKLISELL